MSTMPSIKQYKRRGPSPRPASPDIEKEGFYANEMSFTRII